MERRSARSTSLAACEISMNVVNKLTANTIKAAVATVPTNSTIVFPLCRCVSGAPRISQLTRDVQDHLLRIAVCEASGLQANVNDYREIKMILNIFYLGSISAAVGRFRYWCGEGETLPAASGR
jgi:hypothetical protein